MATTIGGPGGFVETQILAKTPEGREQLKNIALISGSLAAGALAPAAGAGLGGTALAVGATRFGAGLALGESVYEARDRGFVEGASTYLVGSVFEKLASMTVSGMKKFMASLAADDRAVTAAQMNLLKEMLKYKKSHSGKFSEAAEQRFKDGLAKLAGLNQPKQIGMDQEPFLIGWNRRLSKGDGGTLPPPLAEIPVPGGSAPSVAYAAEKTPKPIDLDAIIRSGDQSVLQYGRNVDERLKWVPPAESFSGVRRTGSAPAFTGVEKRRWVDYVRETFGQEAGDNAARILDDPGFAGFFYPKGYADLSAKYSKMRGLFEDIAIPNEVVVGGSAGIASEGTLFRKVAAPHDLDFGAYISGASKIPYSPSTVDAQVARLSDRSAIESSPIFARLREKFPSLRNAKFRHADYDYQFDIGPDGSNNGDLRYSPDYFTVPMVKPSVSKDGWANRLVTFSVDGEKIDVMLSDAPLGVSRYNPRLGSADAAMGWKRSYTSHGKPRAKDVPDLTGYREYDEDNLMIDPFTGQSQFSSFMFPARSYMLSGGLPRVVEMPIRPGHDLKVPVIMNDKGEFLNLLKPDPVLSWYRPDHPMFQAVNVSATSETHPVVAIRGSRLGVDSFGEAAGSIGLYPAKDVATLVDDLLRPRNGNWATRPGNRFKDVIIYPRGVIDPRANPRNAVWDVDAYTEQGIITHPKASRTELKEVSDTWTANTSRYSLFPYGSNIPNYPEINSAYRVNLYSENPASHFSGSPALNIYHGYGEAKSGNVIPADDYVRIPGSLMEKDPEKARSVLTALIQRMKFMVPAAIGGAAYGVSESETRQDSKGGQAADVRAAIGGGDGGEGSPSASPATPAAPVPAGSRRIVINPSTFRNRKDALCVAWNERLRIFMEETAFEPTSEPTAKQRRFFSDTAYADDEVQLRRTILARIAVLDTSVTDPTDDQLMETMQVLQAFKGRERPTNENEAAQLDRLVGLVSSAVRARPSPGPGAAG